MNENDELPPLSIIGEPRQTKVPRTSLGEESNTRKKSRKKAAKNLAEKKKQLKAAEEFLDVVAPKEEAAPKLPEPEVVVEDEAPKQKVLWEPLSDVHKDFLASSEDEVLMAGGRGSGKSECLIVDPLRFCHKKNFRGLILRRTMKELRELIGRAQELYPAIYPGTKWGKQEGIFLFPSGAKIEFGYCDRVPEDIEQYKGQEYQWLGLDELTQWASEEIIERMSASLRTTDPTLPVYIRATTNPDGPGRMWVKDRFIDVAPSGKTASTKLQTPKGEMTLTKKWIHSTVFDNPVLMDAQPQYVAKLMSLKGRMREVWLDGSWDAADGMAFDEFDRRVHVLEPFDIPASWPRFCAVDWGYSSSSLAVCLWFAVDEEGAFYIYREFVANGPVPVEDKYDAPNFARKLSEIEEANRDRVDYTVIDGAVNQNHGHGFSMPTIFEQMKRGAPGRRWKFANKAKGSRVDGKNLIHSLLAIDQELAKPRLQIFNNCTQIIRELSSLPIDPTKVEDVVTKGVEDHAYDALRYGLSSRPTKLQEDPWKPKPPPNNPTKYF